MTSFTKQVLRIGAAILMINTLGVWVVLFIDYQKLSKLEAFEQNTRLVQKEKASIQTGAGQREDTSADTFQNTQSAFETRLQTLESSVSALQKNTASSTTKKVTTSSSVGSQKEYIIYLGTGSTNHRDWTTIDSAFVALDTSKYQHISAVYFEAGLSVIGGEVYARLIDADIGAVVSSEIMHNTQTSTWKSTQFSLKSGNHTYVVQIKSSSGDDVTMSGSRIRIIAD